MHRVAYSPQGDRILSAGQDGAALWNIAGNVDPKAKLSPLAKSFEKVESINGWDSGLKKPPIGPLEDAGDWSVIEVGDTPRLHTLPREWLDHAQETRRIKPNHGVVKKRSSARVSFLPNQS